MGSGPSSALIGESLDIGEYTVRVRRLLSESGGWGGPAVYAVDSSSSQANDTRTTTTKYALKRCRVAKDDGDLMQMAQRERNTLADLPRHPNLVEFYASEQVVYSDDTTKVDFYALMELCEGGSVQDLVQARRKENLQLEETEIMDIFEQVCNAVKALHSALPTPIAHRDVRLENVLVGGDGKFKLCDFGSASTAHAVFSTPFDIARAEEEIEKNTSVAYRAPEQIDLFLKRRVCERVDCWALGIFLFKCCFFRTPFEERGTGSVQKIGILNGRWEQSLSQKEKERVSAALLALIDFILKVDTIERPTVLQILERVEGLRTSGDIPDWRRVGSSQPQPPEPATATTTTWLAFGDKDPYGALQDCPSTTGDESPSRAKSPSSPANSAQLWMNRRQRQGSFASINTDSDSGDGNDDATGAAAALPVKNRRASTTNEWMRGIGEKVAAGKFRILGAFSDEKERQRWICKASSRIPGASKAKYVRKIVISLWEDQEKCERRRRERQAKTNGSTVVVVVEEEEEEEEDMDDFPALQKLFDHLEERPLYDHPIVAMKALFVVLKVLQQGPPAVLAAAFQHVLVVARIGRTWGKRSESASLADAVSSDPRTATLIARFAAFVELKLHFHHSHPDITDVDSAADRLSVVSKLLHLSAAVNTCQRQIHDVAASDSRVELRSTAASCLQPLVEESFRTFEACTKSLSELMRGATASDGFRERLVVVRTDYDAMLNTLRVLYREATKSREFFADQQNIPVLPPGNPIGEDGSMSAQSSGQCSFPLCRSKEEVLQSFRGLEQDEDRRLETEGGRQQPAAAPSSGRAATSSDPFPPPRRSRPVQPLAPPRAAHRRGSSSEETDLRRSSLMNRNRNRSSTTSGMVAVPTIPPPRSVSATDAAAASFDPFEFEGSATPMVAVNSGPRNSWDPFEENSPRSASTASWDPFAVDDASAHPKGGAAGDGSISDPFAGTDPFGPECWGGRSEDAAQPPDVMALQVAQPPADANRMAQFIAQPWRQNMDPSVTQSVKECIEEWSTSAIVMSHEELEVGDSIGSGAFANVYRGLYCGTAVAIKKLVTNGVAMPKKSVEDFTSEVRLMKQLRHPNIVLFIGTCLTPIAMIIELCDRGNLFDFLHDLNQPLSWQLKLKIAFDTCRGMRYLHTREPIIIHRDLKSLNLLLDQSWTTKVSDFGLSRFKAQTESTLTGQVGTYHWMSPEVINNEQYTEKADVYSFGIILWEIYTRLIPYDGMAPVQVVAAVVMRNERPALPDDLPQQFRELLEACWAQSAAARPSFAEAATTLQALKEAPRQRLTGLR